MLQDNYTQDLPIFKGVTVKYFRESEDNNSYEAFIEMPVKEHHCPHCGYATTYIKDYRLQKVKDLSLAGKPLKVTIRKRRYICKNCNSTFTENNPYIKRYCHFPQRFYFEAIKETFNLQSFSAIAKRFGTSVTSIIRWFDNINYPKAELPSFIAIDEFKGLNEGANAGDDKKKAAYYAGIQIGQQISNQMMKGINHELFGEDSTKTISLKNFMAGFISGTTGKGGLMSIDSAQMVAQKMMQSIKAKTMEKAYGPNKVAGEKFLAANAKKEGVKTLPGGVQYKVIKVGTGKIPTDTSMVKVNYEGRTIDGKVFDSSYKRNMPADFRCNQVIKGWTTALTHMPAGSVWEVYIPQNLAYGEREQGQIKPFSVLIFKIELISVGGK